MPVGDRTTVQGPNIQQWFGVPSIEMELIAEEVDVQVRESDSEVTTGIEVKYRDRLTFSANGSIWAGVWLTGANGPNGWNNIDLDPKFPLRASHPYALIGRLSGRYFFIGDGLERWYLRQGSRLSLRTNDDQPGNGTGAFYVTIQQWRRRI